MRRSPVSVLAAAALGVWFASPARADGPADFSGFSLGADAGVALGSAGGSTTSGPAGGAHFGYMLQNGGVVGGAEVDAIFGSVRAGNVAGGSFTQDFLSSARFKAGYAFGNLLPYGTIGWAYSTSNYQDPSGSSNKTIGGDVFGFGAELALTKAVSIRGEYFRYDFNHATYDTPFSSRSMSASTNLLRIGASLHF